MKHDEGSIHRLFSLFLIMWTVILLGVILTVAKIGLVDQHLEDSLMQANLSATLIDPYQYGASNELVFADAMLGKATFERCLVENLGSKELLQRLGVLEDVKVLEFRLYELREDGILERAYTDGETCILHRYDPGAYVTAPDGTQILSSSIYTKISVPVKTVLGIEVTAIKEHCVDVVEGEVREDEET